MGGGSNRDNEIKRDREPDTHISRDREIASLKPREKGGGEKGGGERKRGEEKEGLERIEMGRNK